MKTINYRGGLVSFEIPDDWAEEYDKNGGGNFYDRAPNTGTLRLHVLTLVKEGLVSALDPLTQFDEGAKEVLPNGLRYRHYVKSLDERGMALLLNRWEVLVTLSPSKWRLACFTHTALKANESSPQTLSELATIEAAIRSARFSTTPTAAEKRPWWKFWR